MPVCAAERCCLLFWKDAVCFFGAHTQTYIITYIDSACFIGWQNHCNRSRIDSSGKMKLVDGLLQERHGDKCLIFGKTYIVLDVVEA